jgi:hypothetical protein
MLLTENFREHGKRFFRTIFLIARKQDDVFTSALPSLRLKYERMFRGVEGTHSTDQ